MLHRQRKPESKHDSFCMIRIHFCFHCSTRSRVPSNSTCVKDLEPELRLVELLLSCTPRVSVNREMSG